MKRPTEGEIARAVAALVPFAQEWRLPLEPEDLRAMAVAVLVHAHGDEALEEIDATAEDDDLAPIEGRAARATPGPWQSFVEGRDHTSGDDFIRTGGLDDASPDMYVRHSFPDRAGLVPASVEDQDFIAHARQDVPRLVAEVRRLRARLGEH